MNAIIPIPPTPPQNELHAGCELSELYKKNYSSLVGRWRRMARSIDENWLREHKASKQQSVTQTSVVELELWLLKSVLFTVEDMVTALKYDFYANGFNEARGPQTIKREKVVIFWRVDSGRLVLTDLRRPEIYRG